MYSFKCKYQSIDVVGSTYSPDNLSERNVYSAAEFLTVSYTLCYKKEFHLLLSYCVYHLYILLLCWLAEWLSGWVAECTVAEMEMVAKLHVEMTVCSSCM